MIAAQTVVGYIANTDQGRRLPTDLGKRPNRHESSGRLLHLFRHREGKTSCACRGAATSLNVSLRVAQVLESNHNPFFGRGGEGGSELCWKHMLSATVDTPNE